MNTDPHRLPLDMPTRWETVLTYAVWLAAGILYAPFISLVLAAPFGYFLETCDSSRSPASYTAVHWCVAAGAALGAATGFLFARSGTRPQMARIAVIVGLLLWALFFIGAPAVNAVRIASNRVICSNHLKAIGQGLDQYHDVHGAFPSGTMANPALQPEQRLSWCVTLLPYVGQRPLYDQIDHAQAWDSEKNTQAACVSLEIFHCPGNWHKAERGQPALTHYVGITGVGRDSAMLPKNNPRAGFFGFNRVISHSDILDGTANTLAILDTSSNNGPWAAGGAATLRPIDPSTRPYLGNNRPFGGTHRDSATGLFADGSVRSIWDTKDEAIEAMATIGGGERIPLP
jgi:hypothetical protein